jgi:hypothetical protein
MCGIPEVSNGSVSMSSGGGVGYGE